MPSYDFYNNAYDKHAEGMLKELNANGTPAVFVTDPQQPFTGTHNHLDQSQTTHNHNHNQTVHNHHHHYSPVSVPAGLPPPFYPVPYSTGPSQQPPLEWVSPYHPEYERIMHERAFQAAQAERHYFGDTMGLGAAPMRQLIQGTTQSKPLRRLAGPPRRIMEADERREVTVPKMAQTAGISKKRKTSKVRRAAPEPWVTEVVEDEDDDNVEGSNSVEGDNGVEDEGSDDGGGNDPLFVPEHAESEMEEPVDKSARSGVKPWPKLAKPGDAKRYLDAWNNERKSKEGRRARGGDPNATPVPFVDADNPSSRKLRKALKKHRAQLRADETEVEEQSESEPEPEPVNGGPKTVARQNRMDLSAMPRHEAADPNETEVDKVKKQFQNSRRSGQGDPENFEIFRLYEKYGDFKRVAKILNEARIAVGKTPSLTANICNCRYNRSAPGFFGTMGIVFVRIADRAGTKGQASGHVFTEEEEAMLWDDDLDLALIKHMEAYEAEKWTIVAEKIRRQHPDPDNPDFPDEYACANRIKHIKKSK